MGPTGPTDRRERISLGRQLARKEREDRELRQAGATFAFFSAVSAVAASLIGLGVSFAAGGGAGSAVGAGLFVLGSASGLALACRDLMR